MIKTPKDIILQKNRTRIEIKSVDGWIYSLRYLVNSRETYSAQIIKDDIPGRVESLKREGFKVESKELNTVIS